MVRDAVWTVGHPSPCHPGIMRKGDELSPQLEKQIVRTMVTQRKCIKLKLVIFVVKLKVEKGMDKKTIKFE